MRTAHRLAASALAPGSVLASHITTGPPSPVSQRLALALLVSIAVRAPGAFNSDLSLFRRFAMTERVNMEFRAEAFNWTNTPRFNHPSSGINSLQPTPTEASELASLK